MRRAASGTKSPIRELLEAVLTVYGLFIVAGGIVLAGIGVFTGSEILRVPLWAWLVWATGLTLTSCVVVSTPNPKAWGLLAAPIFGLGIFWLVGTFAAPTGDIAKQLDFTELAHSLGWLALLVFPVGSAVLAVLNLFEKKARSRLEESESRDPKAEG